MKTLTTIITPLSAVPLLRSNRREPILIALPEFRQTAVNVELTHDRKRASTMKVKELMSSDVKTCRLETNLAEAVGQMWQADCGALPIVAEDGRIAGVITDRDICIALATRGRPADRIAVRDVAHRQPYTCLPDDDASVALNIMKMHKVRRLPVVDGDGRVRGMLSLNDVVTHANAASPGEVIGTLASICEHRQPHVVAGAA